MPPTITEPDRLRPPQPLPIDDPPKRPSPASFNSLPLPDPKPHLPTVDSPALPQKSTSILSLEPLETSKADPEPGPPKPVDPIDMDIFRQILELDEDGTFEFSREMTLAYFSQAIATFKDMDHALATKDLPELSSLGHFLKGSSAALGVSKVQASCETIQHYGQLRDEELGKDLTPETALQKIDQLLEQVKGEYAAAEAWLRNWYDEHGGEPSP